jgi:cytochrome c oxidase subunit 2
MRYAATSMIQALVLGAGLMLGCHSASTDDTGPAKSAMTASEAAGRSPAAQDARAQETAKPGGAAQNGDPASGAAQGNERVIRITAKRFEYSPSSIDLKKGEPVVLELVSLDRVHGFNVPDFKLRSDVKPDTVTRLRFTPDKSGTFEFHCDVFCGSGHEDMSGQFVVRD